MIGKLISLCAALGLLGIGTCIAAPVGARSSSAVDPHQFVRAITNPYLPMKPGTTFVYRGIKGNHSSRNVVQITRRTKIIEGVTCVVVHDRVWEDGSLTEDTLDWYAQ